MPYLPMDVPAEIHRWAKPAGAGRSKRCEVIVARGPLVIMAHGLLSLDPSARKGCWITSAMGDMTAEEAEEALRHWSAAH